MALTLLGRVVNIWGSGLAGSCSGVIVMGLSAVPSAYAKLTVSVNVGMGVGGGEPPGRTST